MILGFITKFVFGIIKKIIILILIIVVAVWYFFFKGKDFKFDWNYLKDTVYNDYLKGVQVEVMPNKNQQYEITDEIKTKIDLWVNANDLNTYGDPKSTVYIGGTPLFNEKTGENIDKYDYIINNHQELLDLFK